MADDAESAPREQLWDARGERSPGPTDDTPAGEDDVMVVVLAGGASRRFGSPSDDKLDAQLGDRSVLDVTLGNVPDGWPIIVVGPDRAALATVNGIDGRGTGARSGPTAWVQDDPPLGGPVAAIATALPYVGTRVCAVLAGDTPFGGIALPALRRAIGEHDGAQLLAHGRTQPLIATYLTASLRSAVAQLPRASGASMRAVLDVLDLVTVDVDTVNADAGTLGALDLAPHVAHRVAQDVDTVDDLARLREHGPA